MEKERPKGGRRGELKASISSRKRHRKPSAQGVYISKYHRMSGVTKSF